MKVYAVGKHYENGRSYEEYYDYDCTMVICATREKAEEFISQIALDKDWIDGCPDGYSKEEFGDVERVTYCSAKFPEYDDPETAVYFIDEYELLT